MYYSAATIALVAAFVSNVQAHGVLLQAVGDAGKSQGFLVDTTLARNCTTISPCQQDSTIIRDSEIKQNIVNGCGRTEINGNIDIGEQTENELAVKRITQVSKGSVMQVTIHQVNADGDRDRWFTAQEALEYGFVDHLRESATEVAGGGGTDPEAIDPDASGTDQEENR